MWSWENWILYPFVSVIEFPQTQLQWHPNTFETRFQMENLLLSQTRFQMGNIWKLSWVSPKHSHKSVNNRRSRKILAVKHCEQPRDEPSQKEGKAEVWQIPNSHVLPRFQEFLAAFWWKLCMVPASVGESKRSNNTGLGKRGTPWSGCVGKPMAGRPPATCYEGPKLGQAAPIHVRSRFVSCLPLASYCHLVL